MLAVEIIITGLCSILNAKNEYKTLPEPSMIVVRTGPTYGHTARHIPFIAWDKSKADGVSVTGTFNEIKVEGATVNTLFYFVLNGERIEVVGDAAGPPDASQFGGIASHVQYSRNPASTQWNRCYIPRETERPQKACVVGFMRFGGGKLTADRFTPFNLEFRDIAGTTAGPAQYAREAIYTTAAPETQNGKPSVVLAFRDLATDAIVRSFRFTAKNASDDIQIFIGNDTERSIHFAVERYKREPTPTTPAVLHFHALNMAVTNNPGAPIPFRTDIALPPIHIHGPGGGETGYCGPNEKP